MHPVMVAGTAQRNGFIARRAADGRDAFLQHQPADGRQQNDVEKRNDQIELADAAQQGEQPHTDGRPAKAADQQHGAELHIQRAAAKMGNGAGDRGSDDLVCTRGNGHDRRNIVEDQKRGDEEPTAHPEHAGEKPTAAPMPRMMKTFTDNSAMGR